MFYSHNLLAKKGPLGTVWCAAHLQNRLKKSNYITINIPSTVEQIMNPQVPIALRMSGHLLLGVVRIYSKKVEYLQHDYNVLSIDISKAYAYADITLPQDANQAKFESITLPDNFALDLMDIDEYDPNRSPDSHLRRNEDISFADDSPVRISKRVDQTPSGYIRITVGEEAPNTPSPSGDISGPRLTVLEENPHTPPPTMKDVQDPVIDHLMESNDTFRNEDSIPSPEYRRDADNGGNSYLNTPFKSILPETVEPDLELELQLTRDKGFDSLNLDEIVDHGGPPSPPNQTQPQKSAHSEPEPEPVQDMSDPHISFGLAPSPPPVEPVLAPEQPRVKRRRIKYDKATVLTNEFMKKSIDDPSDLKRKRKGVSSFLGVWKRNNAYKKEKVLFDPLITGLCDNHRQMFEEGYVSSKPNMINTEEPNPDATEVGRSAGFVDPNDNVEEPSPDAMEIGRSAAFVDPNENNIFPNNSPDNRSFNSPRTEAENTPAISSDIGSKLYQAQTTVGTGIGSTPDPTSSIGSFVSETETPFPFSESHYGFNNSGGLSDIPEVDDAGELACLEDDEATPGLKDTPNSSGQRRSPPDSGSLLPRTRAVAQYIKEKSTVTPTSSENLASVSMKSILQGKTRKVCSRFFFETLVLKTCDLVDVKQDEPYGDVTLKVTPKLSKLHFSN